MTSRNVIGNDEAAAWVNPADLSPWDRNPRQNDGSVDAVARSIERFGFGAPIVARREDRRIIAGHTRWKAARKLGLDRVPNPQTGRASRTLALHPPSA